ncbi:MAG: glycosyltransferase family 2 protein [Pauljensenia sp.]
MPDLSVILPARNAASDVARAVSSTLRALPRDAELVVLDDGSSDTTAQEVLRGAGGADAPDPRLRLLRRPPSGGITPALTSLLAESDSRLVARMDADDVCLPWRFRMTLPHLDRGCDLVFSQVVNLVGRRPDPEVPVGIPPRAFPLHLLLTNPVSHPTAVARREMIDRVGGYRAVPAEDYDLWIRCATAGAQIRRVAAWGLLYRIHPGQITASDLWRRSSWDDVLQAQAFADLSEELVGVRLPRLVSLSLLPVPAREEELERFRRAVLPAIDALGGVQARFLRRRLRARSAWVRSRSVPGTGVQQGETT